jgi:hypothetical protein
LYSAAQTQPCGKLGKNLTTRLIDSIWTPERSSWKKRDKTHHFQTELKGSEQSNTTILNLSKSKQALKLTAAMYLFFPRELMEEHIYVYD